ncbi:MAG: hypothetical protein C5B59_00605 [Bacteroidetes bacterium]|nr:MAG: hypothetical protein C5B59_00605 [Bacteroidota bacterium]
MIFLVVAFLPGRPVEAQDADALIQKLRSKMETVKSYEADGVMKTTVTYLKVPEAKVKLYFKRPDKLKIRNENGISLVPKSILGISIQNIFSGQYTALFSGYDSNGLRILKLIPKDENSDIALSTLYVDESNLLIRKAKITTKENGTYELEMTYGKYASYALPDKLICSFNLKDYKLPKGVTFDYDDGSKKQTPLIQSAKGQVEIRYTSYLINKPIPDNMF